VCVKLHASILEGGKWYRLKNPICEAASFFVFLPPPLSRRAEEVRGKQFSPPGEEESALVGRENVIFKGK